MTRRFQARQGPGCGDHVLTATDSERAKVAEARRIFAARPAAEANDRLSRHKQHPTQRHFIGSKAVTPADHFPDPSKVEGHFLSPRTTRTPTRHWDRTVPEFTQSTSQHGRRRKSSGRNRHSNPRTGLRSAIIQPKAQAGADSRLDSRSEKPHWRRRHEPALRFFGRLERVDDDMEEIDSDNRRRRNQGILVTHRLTSVNAGD